MVFLIIGIVVTLIAAVLCVVWNAHEDWCSEGAFVGSAISGFIAFMLMVIVICVGVEAKTEKALMQAHLENPANYTYSQLAEHNEKVAKYRVWQGTIFSFYNDVDLQIIDIDSISQKVIIDSKENK